MESVIHTDLTRINQTDHNNRTALSWAVWGGDDDTTQKLLSYGSNCNKKDNFGRSPLHYAARSSLKCTKLLLKAGADAQAPTLNLLTPLHFTLQTSTITADQAIQLSEAFIQAGADVNATESNGQTPIMKTAHTGYAEVAELLLNRGADPAVCDKLGENILSRAVQGRRHSLISLLLRERQDHTQNMHEYGTFMHLAAQCADTQSLRLLARGSLKRRDVNVKNKAGLSPVQVALQRKYVDVEWRDAFFDFLRSIDKDQPYVASSQTASGNPQDYVFQGEGIDTRDSSESDGSDDDFEDAVEAHS